MHKLIKAGLGSLVIAGSLLVAAPAQAVTQHCDSSKYPNKVELSGDSATVATNLDPGTYVCLKVGTKVTYAYVNDNGTVSNPDVINRNGNLQGISYYAWGFKPS
jgi:hypothetical protein